MLIKVIIALAIATRPKSFRVSRSTTIKAPAAKPFGYIDDFHKWTAWSPFENLDPNLQRTYSGANTGTGAAYAWSGNNKAGAGSMLITQSRPAEYIAIDLNFTKPFRATNLTEFTLEPASDGTRVTWAMSGDNSTMAKAMSLVMNMDTFLGREFEKGLATLKQVSESQA